MPVEKHPYFTMVEDDELVLWRYMSLAKFLSIIQSEKIFFPNVLSLAVDDPFEGVMPPIYYEFSKWKSIDEVPDEQIRIWASSKEAVVSTIGFEKFKKKIEEDVRIYHAYRKAYFVNCWHINKCESDAMWKLYSKENDGIAVVTSGNALNESLHCAEERIICGKVQYKDYELSNWKFDKGNRLYPVFTKRESFQHENEYRLVHWDTDLTHKWVDTDDRNAHKVFEDGKKKNYVEKTLDDLESFVPSNGMCIDCDIKKMIGRVHISPLAPVWFKQIVEDVLYHYDFHCEVRQSKLNEKPRYLLP